MKIFGLTGGIGSGKSTVAALFRKLGVPVIDADAISHTLTSDGGAINYRIREIWGDTVVDPQGRLNRAALRNIVFNDPDALKQLESILHPAIREKISDQLNELRSTGTPYCLLEVPLLYEKGYESIVDAVIVVDIPEALQITRVKSRSGIEETEIQRIIDSQISRLERNERADIVIDNSNAPEILVSTVTELHQQIINAL